MKRYKSLKDIDNDIERVMKILQNPNISIYIVKEIIQYNLISYID